MKLMLHFPRWTSGTVLMRPPREKIVHRQKGAETILSIATKGKGYTIFVNNVLQTCSGPVDAF